MAENALLHQQVIVLRRNIERPRLRRDDRLLLLVQARLTRRWRDALHVVNPETLLRWHRELFKIIWRRRQAIPAAAAQSVPAAGGKVVPILGGLHHDYQWAAKALIIGAVAHADA